MRAPGIAPRISAVTRPAKQGKAAGQDGDVSGCRMEYPRSRRSSKLTTIAMTGITISVHSASHHRRPAQNPGVPGRPASIGNCSRSPQPGSRQFGQLVPQIQRHPQRAEDGDGPTHRVTLPVASGPGARTARLRPPETTSPRSAPGSAAACCCAPQSPCRPWPSSNRGHARRQPRQAEQNQAQSDQAAAKPALFPGDPKLLRNQPDHQRIQPADAAAVISGATAQFQ